jgi:uncharacterized membrane protein
MTDTQHNGASDEYTSAHNVIAVSFDPDTNAYAALTSLKELDGQGQLSLEAAVVVERGSDGQLVTKDSVGGVHYEGAASLGLLGLLVGILAGPVGVLVGGASGVVFGSVADVDQEQSSDSVLGQISGTVQAGRTALLAEVTEQSPQVVDAAMAGLSGTVLRKPVAEVEAELAAADDAHREAKRQANEELMRGKRERTKEQIQAKVGELKAKLPRHEKSAT